MKQTFYSVINDVLKELLDKLFYVVLSIGIVALTVSVIRSYFHGWNTSLTVNLITFPLIILVLSLRKRLSVPVTFWSIMTAVAIAGAGTLFSLGLAGTGIAVFSAFSILVGIFYGPKPGIAAACLSVLVVLGMRAAISLNLIPYPSVNVAQLLYSPSTWITQSITVSAYTIAVIAAAYSVQQRFSRSLSELKDRTDELHLTIDRLKESEEKYRILSDNVHDGVVVQDIDLNITYYSRSLKEMFGYSENEAFDCTMKDNMTPQSLEQAFSSYKKFLSDAEKAAVSIPLMEYEYIRKDGSTFWGELRTAFLYDKDKRIIGSQSVLRDITERKKNEEEKRRLEEELNQNEKMRVIGRLAGGVAHDFNNQLAGIMGFADLIRQSEQADDNIKTYAQSIVTAAKRSADLTTQLLAFAHRGKIRSEPVDIHSLISETVLILQRSVDRRISILTQLKASTYYVQGDSTQLQNALLNLGLNARDAMPEGGELLISTETVNHESDFKCSDGTLLSIGFYIEISFNDTGHGMDQDTLSHVFEPFYSTKERGKGTGMGLPAVLGTIRNHKGGVDITSELKKGTIVNIYLPIIREQSIQASTKDLPSTADKRSVRIMIVDDEFLVLKVMRLVLEREGHTIYTYENPIEAIAWYKENSNEIDLIIIDMIMPQMDGKAALTELHKHNPYLKALVCSGYNQDYQMEQLKETGARGFLSKPFQAKILSDEVSKIIANKYE